MTNELKIYGTSAIGVLGGAFIGYKIGEHFKKNVWLFGGIGAIAIGLGAYYTSDKFIFKTEKKSGFTTVKGARKCWCASTHGMVQCPCGGNSDKN